MNRSAIAATLIFCCAAVHGQVKCDKSVIGRLACDDAEIKDLLEKTTKAASALGCKGSELLELNTMRRAWGRQAYSCEAATDARACLVQQLSSERGYFSTMTRCNVAEHPVRFDIPVPSYVQRHPTAYKDKKVKVLGVMKLASCDPKSTSVSGKIFDYGNNRGWIAVKFKSMPAVQRRFLCKQPLSAWNGTVRLSDSMVPTLESVDVLGVKLP